MGRSELEVCIEQSIRQINELDVKAVSEGVRNVHKLLFRLIQTNRGQLSAGAVSSAGGKNESIVDTSTLNTLNSELPEREQEQEQEQE